jgi:hypothetical protein
MTVMKYSRSVREHQASPGRIEFSLRSAAMAPGCTTWVPMSSDRSPNTRVIWRATFGSELACNAVRSRFVCRRPMTESCLWFRRRAYGGMWYSIVPLASPIEWVGFAGDHGRRGREMRRGRGSSSNARLAKPRRPVETLPRAQLGSRSRHG